MELTKAQQQAIEYSGRNLQLIACAGSGKTEVVAQRIAHLLTKQGGDRLEPRNIVAFTFTEKTAAELKERIVRRTRDANGGDITGMAEMYVGTIHGFCQELLQNEVPEYLKYEVLDSIRQQLYINRKSSLTGLTTSTDLNDVRLRRYVSTGNYISALAMLREDEVDPQKLTGCSVMDGLEKYSAQIAADSYFDFSSQLVNAVAELESNDGLRSRVADRIKYVVVDEYQDVNPIQERLVRIIHDLGANLCVVGDDDQTIYQWRGSAVENIIKFQDRYPDVEQIRLEENFRSSEGVINTARQFVNKVNPRLPKEMKYADAQPYESGDVVALSFDSPVDEARYIAETVKSLRGAAFADGDGQRGLSWSDMAVLLRSVKNNGAVITEAFKEAGVPFVVTGLNNLFETDEACAARELFYYIANENADDQELRRVWTNANIGFNTRKLNGALRYAQEVHDTVHSDKQDNPPSIQTVYLRFLDLAGLREEKVPGGRGQVVLFNLGKFSQIITDWEAINFSSKPLESFQGFGGFLHYQAEGSYSEGTDDGDYVVPDAVQIMTVHQAKGREWPAVFMPALLRNRFPSPSAASRVWNLIPKPAIANSERYDGSIDDERRLFYVAMTRSKKFLHMTWAPINGKGYRYQRSSEFWDDVLASKFVRRRKPNYANRNRAPARPRATVANVEFSFSDLKYLYECGYQFKLRVLYGFNTPIALPLGYGKSLHDALAEVHQRAMRGDIVTEADTDDLVARHLRTPYAYGEVRRNLEQAAHRDISNYIKDRTDDLSRIEFSEQTVEINLDDGVSIKGRIDLVRRTDTDEVSIVDLKSNERSQQEDITEAQLHTYALGYKELTGQDADFVETYQLAERRAIPRAVDEDFIADVREQTQAAAVALRKMELLPSPSAPKCRNCDFSALCSASRAWAGVLAPTPIPC